MKRYLSILLSLTIFVTACRTNAITGRSQLALVSEEALRQEAVQQYRSFLSQADVVSPNASKDAAMVKRVGNRVANAIEEYYSKKGLSDQIKDYNWEFNLVKSPEVNAWAMPGGKVAVYTGLLNVTQNEAALAIVMGHEIMHAVAHHGQERISQALLAQGIGVAGNIFTQGNAEVNNIFNAIYAPTAQIGVLLPNSRRQEYVADHYGLIFAAMAGYNPRVAIPFWERMADLKKGHPPELLMSHPLDRKRIRAIKGFMDEALEYYQPVEN